MQPLSLGLSFLGLPVVDRGEFGGEDGSAVRAEDPVSVEGSDGVE
ncbi:hypothetical protein [Lentzea sp. NPDC004782]